MGSIDTPAERWGPTARPGVGTMLRTLAGAFGIAGLAGCGLLTEHRPVQTVANEVGSNVAERRCKPLLNRVEARMTELESAVAAGASIMDLYDRIQQARSEIALARSDCGKVPDASAHLSERDALLDRLQQKIDRGEPIRPEDLQR